MGGPSLLLQNGSWIEVEARKYNCVAWDPGTWVHNASITGLVSTHAVAPQFWRTYGVISAYLMVKEGLACLSLWRS